MIRELTHAARRLDLWLQARLGRPYNALLGVGLTIELVHRLTELPATLAIPHRLIGGLLVVAMELALLVHQVAELSHHIDARRSRNAKAEQRGLFRRR